ncbi:MAG: hypothetical protein ACRD43_04260, partial [Pyrinomonadaceae bacterium]
MKKKFLGIVALCILLSSAAFASTSGDKTHSKKKHRRVLPVKITGVPVGPTSEALKAAISRISSSSGFQKNMAGVKYRVLSSHYVDDGTQKPSRFQAVIYDYTNDRTFSATGDISGKEDVALKEESYQPGSSDEEFAEAVAIVRNSVTSLSSGSVYPFGPMPPVTVLNGSTERLVNVGLSARDSSGKNEIVGVSLKRGVVVHYPNNAPPTALATADACGPPAVNPGPNPNGSGAVQITVT